MVLLIAWMTLAPQAASAAQPKDGPCSTAALEAKSFRDTKSRVVGKVTKMACSKPKGTQSSCRTTLLVTKVLTGCVPRGYAYAAGHTRGEPPPDDNSGGSFRFDKFTKGSSWEFLLCYWKSGAEWAACSPVPAFTKP